jgi:hypothetical protein
MTESFVPVSGVTLDWRLLLLISVLWKWIGLSVTMFGALALAASLCEV